LKIRTGGGRFFHIKSAKEFVAFRVQNVGGPAGIERVAGRRAAQCCSSISIFF
jgi:hypothetical protein